MSESKLDDADRTVDRAADKLQETADSFAAQGGVKEKAAQPLADDADFLRKLKPSKIAARAKGELPTDEQPGAGHVDPAAAPTNVSSPSPPNGRRGPNPWLVVGIALGMGILVAKIIDWRGHAHPR